MLSGTSRKSRMLESERLFPRPYPGLFIFHQHYWNSNWGPRSWPLNKHVGAWSSSYSFHMLLGVQKLSRLQQNPHVQPPDQLCVCCAGTKPASRLRLQLYALRLFPITVRAASRRPLMLPLGPLVQVRVGSPLVVPAAPFWLLSEHMLGVRSGVVLRFSSCLSCWAQFLHTSFKVALIYKEMLTASGKKTHPWEVIRQLAPSHCWAQSKVQGAKSPPCHSRDFARWYQEAAVQGNREANIWIFPGKLCRAEQGTRWAVQGHPGSGIPKQGWP